MKKDKRIKEEKEKKLNKFKKQQTKMLNGKSKNYDSDDSFRTERSNEDERESNMSEESFFIKEAKIKEQKDKQNI